MNKNLSNRSPFRIGLFVCLFLLGITNGFSQSSFSESKAVEDLETKPNRLTRQDRLTKHHQAIKAEVGLPKGSSTTTSSFSGSSLLMTKDAVGVIPKMNQGNIIQAPAAAAAAGPIFYNFDTETAGSIGPFLNGWVGANSSTYTWVAWTGLTGSPDTGPSADHTTGLGIYMFTEASLPATTGDTASLTSPYIEIDTFSNPGIGFWTHRYGASIGNMVVYANDGLSGWVPLVNLVGEWQSDELDPWAYVEVPLCALSASDSVQIRFTAFHGGGWAGDMAVDDVGIVNIVSVQDAAISASDMLPTTYTIFPESQQNVTGFTSDISNLGSEDFTGLKLKTTLGAWSDSATQANFNCGTITNLSTSSPAGPYAIGNYEVYYELSANEVDDFPNNNFDTLRFEISDSVYARDDNTLSGSLGIGPGNAGILGQNFDVLNADTLTSVTFWLNAPTVGDTVSVGVYSFTTTPQTLLATTNSEIIASSTGAWYTLSFPTPQILSPGTYFLGLNEGVANNITLGTTTSNFQPNTGWVIFGANPWAPSEAYGFLVTYLLRANFGPPKPIQGPANDDICNAAEFVLNSGVINADNTNAGTELGEPAGSCWWLSDGVQNSIWYYYVAGANDVTVTTDFSPAGTNDDTQLTAYSSTGGCNGTLTQIACNEDVSLSNLLSTMVVTGVTPGDTVWVQVDGYQGLQGTFQLAMTDGSGGGAQGPIFFDFETETSGSTGNLNNGWVASPTTDFSWIANAGPTGSPGTGPAVDHTLGTALGIYMYTEASLPAAQGDIATLESPFIVIDTFTNPAVSFWYHMFGADMGELITSVFDGSTWIPLDTLSGPAQGSDVAPWIERRIDISAIAADSIRIRFTGICGADFTSDMAVDDVGIVNIPAFDAELVGGGTAVNGAFYTIIPESQQNLDFAGLAANVGASGLTGVQLKATAGSWTDSVSTPTLASGASSLLSINNPSGLAVGNYNVTMELTSNENDADPSDNSLSYQLEISDSVYARDNDNPTGTLGIGPGFTGTLGQIFEVQSTDTITSVSFHLGSNTPLINPIIGDVLDISLYNFNGVPDTIMVTTDSMTVTTATPQWYTLSFPTPQELTPGTYFLGVNERAPNNVALATSPFNYAPNTGWVIFGGNPWAPSEAYGFQVTYLLRANFGEPVFTSIADFNLLSPSSGTLVLVEGASTDQVVIDWEDAVVTGGPAASYTFMLDNPGGDFSSPIYSTPSDNSGADSELTLSMSDLETLLSSLGANPGDTVEAIWQVNAVSGSVELMALSDFDVSFFYGVVGLDRSFFDESISMYPNPTERTVTIEINNDLVTGINVQNLLGQSMIKDDWMGQGKRSYDLSGLSSGVYIVNFQTPQGEYSKKLIIR